MELPMLEKIRSATPTLEDEDFAQLIDLPSAAMRQMPRLQTAPAPACTELVDPATEHEHSLEVLRAAIPEHMVWRNEGDVLANLPPPGEAHAVAQLRMGSGAEVAQEDVCGATWVHLLLTGGERYVDVDDRNGESDCVHWLIVPGASKRAAIAEWQRRRAASGRDAWPTAAELSAAGVAGARAFVQNPGKLISVPPHALAVRRVSRHAVLLQWSRATALACLNTANLRAAAAVAGGGDSARGRLGSPTASVLDGPALPWPSAEEEKGMPPEWRRLQCHPPVALATFLSLAAAVRRAEAVARKGGAPLDGAAREELRELLEPCRALVAAERLTSSSSSSPSSSGTASAPPDAHALPVERLHDKAPRACDHCAADIFNRAVRLTAPKVVCTATAGGTTRLVPEPAAFNPRRRKQRRKGDAGDFCLGARPPARAACARPALLPPSLSLSLYVCVCGPWLSRALAPGARPPAPGRGSRVPCLPAPRSLRLRPQPHSPSPLRPPNPLARVFSVRDSRLSRWRRSLARAHPAASLSTQPASRRERSWAETTPRSLSTRHPRRLRRQCAPPSA